MGSVDALKYGDVWILAEKGEAMPSEGHAIDHIGWRTHNGPKREGRRAQSQGCEVYNRAQALPRHPHFLCRRSGGCEDRIVAALRAAGPVVQPPARRCIIYTVYGPRSRSTPSFYF